MRTLCIYRQLAFLTLCVIDSGAWQYVEDSRTAPMEEMHVSVVVQFLLPVLIVLRFGTGSQMHVYRSLLMLHLEFYLETVLLKWLV